jgi:Kef-type K+ transport system membrane component KefB
MLTGQILLQLIVILLIVQLFGTLCRLIGQQWVIGEILAGLALGPSLLGALWPTLQAAIFPANVLPTLQALGDVGLILYMFSLGARLDTDLMLGQSRKALIASLAGILFPLLLGGALAFFLYPTQAGHKATLVSFVLLMGTSMAVTAFPVLARFLAEKQMIGTHIGILALTCAAVDDVVAWCLLALVVAIIHSSGFVSVLLTLGIVILLAVGMFTVVRPFLFWVERHVRSSQLLIVLTMVLLLGSAFITNVIGIHPIFGAFVMGVILPRRTAYIDCIRNIDKINSLLFLPLFFVYSGLRTQIGLISAPALWLICLAVLLIACIGKIAGGTLSVRWMGDSWKNSLTLGVLMNTRGLVELIVLNIGLDLGILSPTLFVMLVIMAIITTMMASPLLPLLGYRQSGQSTPQKDLPESTEVSLTSHADLY